MKNITTCFLLLITAACGGSTGDENFAPLFSTYEYFIIQSAPEAVGIGDVNGDGKNDVVVTTSDGYSANEDDYMLLAYYQKNEGISSIPEKHTTQVLGGTAQQIPSVDIGDINNDGRNDVIVGHEVDSIEIFTQGTDSNLVSSNSVAALSASFSKIGDFNNDNVLDLVGVGELFIQESPGNFSRSIYSVERPVSGIEVAKLNYDSLEDIVLLSNDGFSVIFQSDTGLSPPVFYSAGDGLSVNGIATGDINGDGFKDVVVTSGYYTRDAKIEVFYQNKSNSFDSPVRHATDRGPECINIADLNLDGKEDIVVLHGNLSGANIETYLNNGEGKAFTREQYYLGPVQHPKQGALATGDLNNDGRPDIAVATDDGLAIFYQN